MPALIRARPEDPAARPAAPAGDRPPILPPGTPHAGLVYFDLLRLGEGQSARVSQPGFELLFAVMSGRADIEVRSAAGSQRFTEVGRRPDIWSGQADSVYAGTDAEVVVTGRAGRTEIAVAGGKTAGRFGPFRITPEEVEMVDVGSVETHSHRRIFHILGHNGLGRAGNMLVSELRADAGCWSGYPPHKHDTESPPEETAFHEVYHYRYRPETGFGAQLWYAGPDEAPAAHVTRNGDTFAFERGYHPTVTSPGHEAYVFTILVGQHQRSLLQRFDATHGHLINVIPGLKAMQDKFK
jgi:5-deoxy-glucuronate isomerase